MTGTYTIRAVFLQAIKFAEIELTEGKITRFTGENNNGKSIIVKVLWDTISGQISHKEKRLPLINYDSDYGALTLTKPTGETLFVYLHREPSKTYVEFSVPGKQAVRRYLSDKNYQELTQLFGFHYDEKRNISLNIYNTYDPLLFLTTSYRTNGDVIDSATRDREAETSLEHMRGLVTDMDKLKRDMEESKAVLGGRLQALDMYSAEGEEAVYHNATYLADNLEYLVHSSFAEVQPQINVEGIQQLDTCTIGELPPIFKPINVNALKWLDTTVMKECSPILKPVEVTNLKWLTTDRLNLPSVEGMGFIKVTKTIKVLETLSMFNCVTSYDTTLAEFYKFEKAFNANVCPVCERSFEIERREENINIHRPTQVG